VQLAISINLYLVTIKDRIRNLKYIVEIAEIKNVKKTIDIGNNNSYINYQHT
tara:strand:+ start:578 stop:733 length:156 start_codon:yes stop_codon:yes gene_type:complete